MSTMLLIKNARQVWERDSNKMPDNGKITVTIDGRTIEVNPGTLILEAAKQLGIDIPVFCYDERLRPVGACRMCLVEVEKSPKLIASCSTPVAPNMVVHTDSQKVIKARKGVLEFLLINHPLDCPTCDKGGECPLQDMTYGYGPATSRYKEKKIRFIDDINQKFDDIPLGPEILLCRNRCIMCFKCIRIVRELAGEADLGVFQRGAFANINVLDEVKFADEFSGNTVEYCPVGALTSRSFRYKIRNWLLKKSPSVCNLCSDGCNISAEGSYGQIFRNMSRKNPLVDDGWLCDRGRYSFDISRSEDRILLPQIRRNGSLKTCGWDEAIAVMSKHLGKIINENRGSEVAVVGSPLLSNEEAYVIRQFTSNVIKSPNIDFQTEFSKPLEPEMLDLIGLDGTIADTENDSIYIFVGCDPAIEHPVLSLRFKKMIAQKKARAIFIGSHSKKLGNFPVTNIRISFGTEIEAINYLISKLRGLSAESIPAIKSGEKLLDDLAIDIKNTSKVHIIAGNEFLNHYNRQSLLAKLIDLNTETKCKLSLLAPQGNFLGVSHLGLYGGTENSFEKILSRIESGEIKTLMIFGANPLDEYYDRKYVHDALKKLEFLIVCTPLMNPTAAMAALVCPLPTLPYYGGTFINIEGRIQQFQPMTELGSDDIKPAWAILSDISEMLGLGAVWHHELQIRMDIAKNIKGLESLASIPTEGLLINFKNNEIKTSASEKLPIPKAPADYPYILQYSPSVHHSGWMTQKSENLMRISGTQYMCINPADAAREQILEGHMARIGVEDTAINLPAHITDDVNKGEILVINSFPDNTVNRLMKRGKLTTFVSVRKN